MEVVQKLKFPNNSIKKLKFLDVPKKKYAWFVLKFTPLREII